MFLHRVKIFTLAGFSVWIDASWLIFAALVSWTLAIGVFPALVPHLTWSAYWWMAVAGTIGLFVSIVLHELSHSLVARGFSMPITGITLFIFGGVAELHKEPTSARGEFFMAVVGPVTSFVIGAILLGASAFSYSKPLFAVLNYLGAINWLLAAFNLVPAFPLDGGRVLRSALWAWRKDFAQATRIASFAGQVFGIFLIVAGIAEFFTGNFVGGTWFFFIGLFLHGAAGASLQQISVRRVFSGHKVSEFMQQEPIAVSPDLSIRSLIEDYFYHFYFKAFPVVREGRLLGCVMAKQVHDIDLARRETLTVGDVMRPCSPEILVSPDTDALDALTTMQRGHRRLLVVAGDTLLGVLALSDMLQLLALKRELETGPSERNLWGASHGVGRAAH